MELVVAPSAVAGREFVALGLPTERLVGLRLRLPPTGCEVLAADGRPPAHRLRRHAGLAQGRGRVVRGCRAVCRPSAATAHLRRPRRTFPDYNADAEAASATACRCASWAGSTTTGCRASTAGSMCWWCRRCGRRTRPSSSTRPSWRGCRWSGSRMGGIVDLMDRRWERILVTLDDPPALWPLRFRALLDNAVASRRRAARRPRVKNDGRRTPASGANATQALAAGNVARSDGDE